MHISLLLGYLSLIKNCLFPSAPKHRTIFFLLLLSDTGSAVPKVGQRKPEGQLYVQWLMMPTG